jgi:hypothetical protein
MANHCRLHSNSAKASCDSIVDRVDAGAGAGAVVLYTGAEPAYCDSAAGTEVATCTCAKPAYASAAADGVNHWADANLASTASDSSATGNASAVSYFRLEDSNGNAVLQGTVGTVSTDLVMNSVTIGAGAQVDITALEVEVPYNQA